MTTELIYTDGACSKNGSPDAVGGFGIYFAKSSVSESVKINRKGFHMDYETHGTIYVTNIRMEGLAIVSTLALYSDLCVKNPTMDTSVDLVERLNSIEPFSVAGLKPRYEASELAVETLRKGIEIEIVTDSLFWMNVIEKWMPGWIRKKIILQKKNPDILLMMLYHTELLKQNGIVVKFTHVRSHQKGKRTEHADGNDVADILATSAVKNTDLDFHVQ